MTLRDNNLKRYQLHTRPYQTRTKSNSTIISKDLVRKRVEMGAASETIIRIKNEEQIALFLVMTRKTVMLRMSIMISIEEMENEPCMVKVRGETTNSSSRKHQIISGKMLKIMPNRTLIIETRIKKSSASRLLTNLMSSSTSRDRQLSRESREMTLGVPTTQQKFKWPSSMLWLVRKSRCR